MGGPRWTETERDVIRELYPTGGLDAVRVIINRSVSAIYTEASHLCVGGRRGPYHRGPTESTRGKMRAVFEFVVAFKSVKDGLSPTVREIGCAIGLKSTSHVVRILEWLEREGKIQRDSHGIVVIGGRWTYEGEGNEISDVDLAGAAS